LVGFLATKSKKRTEISFIANADFANINHIDIFKYNLLSFGFIG